MRGVGGELTYNTLTIRLGCFFVSHRYIQNMCIGILLRRRRPRPPTLAPAMCSAITRALKPEQSPGAPQPGRGVLSCFTSRARLLSRLVRVSLYPQGVRALTPPSLAPFKAWERLRHCNGTDHLRRRAWIICRLP